MMNHEEGDCMVPVDGFSATRRTVIKFSHIWTIENFAFFLDESFVTSPLFSARTGDGVVWHLRLYPANAPGEDREHIALYLSLRSSHAPAVQATFRFFLMGSGHNSFERMNCAAPRTFTKGVGFGDNRLINRSFLFNNNRTYLPDGHLRIRCEICYLLDPSITMVEYTQCRTGTFVSGLSKEPEEEEESTPDVGLKKNGQGFQAQGKRSGEAVSNYKLDKRVASKIVDKLRIDKGTPIRNSKPGSSSEISCSQAAELCLENFVKAAEEIDRVSIKTTRLVERKFDDCLEKLRRLNNGSGAAIDKSSKDELRTLTIQEDRPKASKATVAGGAGAKPSTVKVARFEDDDDADDSTVSLDSN